MAMAKESAAGARRHIVLVPGFGGFDALGRVEYYAGTTRLFQQWNAGHSLPVVLHYFDNLPTAAVTTRAGRLRQYLAKRMARGEILETDRIVLVGHSTGGLDIRQLICDLHDSSNERIWVDGGLSVTARSIRHCVDAVVFLSVPHWGTNVADWVHSHTVLRKTVIADLRAAVAGSQIYLLDDIEAGIASGAAAFTGADLLLAWRDALTEVNDRLCGRDPSRIAGAQEAASELELYFRHMATDFRVIDDLTSQPHEGGTSPAHFNPQERLAELELWDQPPIRTLSYATVGGRPFRFPSLSGSPAPAFELKNLCAYPDIFKGGGVSAGTDVSYRFCYRACAGGPLQWPAQPGRIARVLGPLPAQPLELWDNDGIVNTVSMLWPRGETALVLADHLDIVGHYRLRRARSRPAGDGCQAPRAYQSYDSLKSAPLFAAKTFREIWTEIFLFAALPEAFERNKKGQGKSVRLAAGAAAAG